MSIKKIDALSIWITEKFGDKVFTPKDIYDELEKDDFKVILKDGSIIYHKEFITKGIKKSDVSNFRTRVFDSFVRKNIIFRLTSSGALTKVSKSPQKLQKPKAKMKSQIDRITAVGDSTTETQTPRKTKPKEVIKTIKSKVVTLKNGAKFNLEDLQEHQCVELKDGSIVTWLGNQFFRIGDSNSKEDFNPDFFQNPEYQLTMGGTMDVLKRIVINFEFGFPSLLLGPTGCGKTEIAQAVGFFLPDLTNKRFEKAVLHKLSLTQETSSVILTGFYGEKENVSGHIEIQKIYSELIQALGILKLGIPVVLLLDELNIAPPNIGAFFNSLFDTLHKLYCDGIGESYWVEGFENLIVIATGNPSYAGTELMNEATKGRFDVIPLTSPNNYIEILKKTSYKGKKLIVHPVCKLLIKQYQKLSRAQKFDIKVQVPSIREMKMLNAYCWTYKTNLPFVVETSIVRAQFDTIYDVWKQVVSEMRSDIAKLGKNSEFYEYQNSLDTVETNINSKSIVRPEV